MHTHITFIGRKFGEMWRNIVAGVALSVLVSGVWLTLPGTSSGAIIRPAVSMVAAAAPIPPGALRLPGTISKNTPLELELLLKPRHPTALTQFVKAVSTPGSAQYHHFLPKGEFSRAFAPTPATTARLLASLRSAGLHPGHVSSDGLFIPVHTTVANAESVLHTHMANFVLPNGKHAIANVSSAELPTSVAPHILTIVGLDNLVQEKPLGLSTNNVLSNMSNNALGNNGTNAASSTSSSTRLPQYPAGLPGYLTNRLLQQGNIDSRSTRNYPVERATNDRYSQPSNIDSRSTRNYPGTQENYPSVLSANSLAALPANYPYNLSYSNFPNKIASGNPPPNIYPAIHSTKSNSTAPHKATTSPQTSGPVACSAAQNTGGWTANQLASAYNFTSAYSSGNLGSGETVALLELAPYQASDISAYQTCYGTSATVNTIPVGKGAPTGTGGSVEDTLDIEDIIGLAPKATIDVYEGPPSSTGIIDTYKAIATADNAQVVSSSWASCETETPLSIIQAENTIFQQMAAQGQSMFAAAGDTGSEGCMLSARPATLSAIACTSSTTCYAVGSNPGSEGIVVSVDNGTSGTIQIVYGTASLNGIACPISTECYAIGGNSNGDGVIVPIDNGVPGTAEIVPAASGNLLALIALSSIACSSSTVCYAVGTKITASSTSFNITGIIVPIDNGTVGAAQTVSAASGGLTGIACSSSTVCYAVGANSNGIGIIVPIGNGTPGTAETVSAVSEGLTGIACSSSTTCYVIGTEVTNPNSLQVSITVESIIMPLTKGTLGTAKNVSSTGSLDSIICPGATTCYAVGTETNNTNSISNGSGGGMLVSIINGTPGTVQSISGTTGLTGIACPSPTTCYDVGGGGGLSGIILTVTDGTLGSVDTVGQPNTGTLLANNIACSSSTTCYIAGQNASNQGIVMSLANGTPGIAQTASAASGGLFGIACSSSTTCYAIGANANGDGMIISIDNGIPGTAETVSGASGGLLGIACSSSTKCYAVGANSNGIGVMVPISNGTPGATQTVSAASGGFYDIACSSSTTCYAIGADSNENSIIIPVDNGIPGTAETVSGKPDQFYAIACSSSTECYVVGTNSNNNGIIIPMDNGTIGTTIQTIWTTGAYGTVCPSSAGCSMVGSLGQTGYVTTATTGGSGTLEPVSGTALLAAIACPTSTECYAAGIGQNGIGAVVPINSGTPGTPQAVSGTALLAAIACPTSTECYAVGANANGDGVIVPIDNGTVGTAETVSAASGGLSGIACSSSTVCYAVGTEMTVSSTKFNITGIIVPIDNGTVGTAETVSAASENELSGITCSSSTTCYATGAEMTALSASSNITGIIVPIDNGTPGTPQAVSGTALLTGITCPSSTTCYAVGTDSGGAGTVVSMAISGSTVTTSTTYTWAGVPYAIACTSTTSCESSGTHPVPGNLYQGFDLQVTDGDTPYPLGHKMIPIPLNVLDPASQPYVTGVGGTDMSAVGNPPTSPPTETTWNTECSGGLPCGGGGGISSVWPMPTYQSIGAVPGVVSSLSSGKPCSATGEYCREVPDVSASADPSNGYVIYYGGKWQEVGGTSGAAPLWAALTSLANESCNSRLGFLNPALYSLASSNDTAFNVITKGNNDVTGMNNGLYPAASSGQRYSMAAGLGTPNGAIIAGTALCGEAGTSSVVAASSNVPASGDSTTTITVTLKNSTGPIVGASVELTQALSSGGTAGSTVSPAVEATSASGVATFTVGDTNIQKVSYSAKDVSSGMTVLQTATVSFTGSPYIPLSPSRICDTRPNNPSGLSGAALSQCEGDALHPNSYLTIHVAGLAGDNVPIGAVGAALNVTAIGATQPTYLTVYPASGSSKPTASSINAFTDTTVANLVVVDLPTTGTYAGEVSIYNLSGTVNVTVDVEGYYIASSITTSQNSTQASLYTPLTNPSRLVDTRCSITAYSFAHSSYCNALPSANSHLTGFQAGEAQPIRVTGLSGVPASGISAVVLNVTATNTIGGGYFTLYPAGAIRPTASNLNWKSGNAVANRVIVPVGSNGNVELYASGIAQAVVDISGYLSLSGTGSSAVALPPIRICDTRPGNPSQLSGAQAQCNNDTLLPLSQITIKIEGVGGLPSSGISAVIINLTAASADSSGYLSVNPASRPPTTSDVNWTGAERIAVPNLVLASVNASGDIIVYNGSGQSKVNIIVDVVGYMSS